MKSLFFNEIVSCNKCSRLREYIKNKEKSLRYKDWEYWNKPVPGIGDENAKILIVGLTPRI